MSSLTPSRLRREVQLVPLPATATPSERVTHHSEVIVPGHLLVEFCPNFLVEGCLWDGDRVEGIRGRDHRHGSNYSEKARITIGADGKHPSLARAVGAPSYGETPGLTCWYFSYCSGVTTEGFEWYVRKNRAIFSFLTNDNLFAIFIGWPIDKFDSVKANIDGQFMQVGELIPGPGRAFLWRRPTCTIFCVVHSGQAGLS